MWRAEHGLGVGLRISKKLRVSRAFRCPSRRPLWPIAMIADGEQQLVLRAGNADEVSRALFLDLSPERERDDG